MRNVVNLKELREHLPRYAARVAKGESLIVMKRSRPLFRISPVYDTDEWETVIDFTKFRKGGIPAKELITKLEAMR